MSGVFLEVMIMIQEIMLKLLEVIVLFMEVIQHVVSMELLGQPKRSHDEHITLLTGILTDICFGSGEARA